MLQATASTLIAGLVISAVGYLTLTTRQGDLGLLRLYDLQTQETTLGSELATVRLDVRFMANKTNRLSSPSIDLELLDARARSVLGLGRSDEILIR